MLKLALTLVLWIPAMSLAAPYSIVIHGGAGTILRDKMSTEVEAEYREVLTKAVKAGHQVLQRGGSSTEAVTQAILVMEDSPLFNAGRGAVFTHDGEVELYASIMRGDDLNAGAVTGVKRVRNPILLAEQVMLNSPHVMLMGAGAEAFAETRELDMVDVDETVYRSGPVSGAVCGAGTTAAPPRLRRNKACSQRVGVDDDEGSM